MRPLRQRLRISIVKALEEADVHGVLWSRKARDEASGRALSDWDGSPGQLDHVEVEERADLFDRRARHLRQTEGAGARTTTRLLLAHRIWLGVAPILVLVALAAGWLADGLTGSVTNGREISLLSAPLWGLVAWNLLRLTVGPLLRRLRRGAARRATGREAGQTLGALLSRLAGGRRPPLGSAELGTVAGDDTRGRVRQAIRAGADRWARDWAVVTAPWQSRRIRAWLHLAAVAAALGWIGSTYQRGLFLAFEASWESTWLDAATVQRLLDLALTPASLLTGIEVPDVAPLERPGRGPAAPWLHLFATTLGWAVVVPRALLTAYDHIAMQRIGQRIQLDWSAPYFARLLSRFAGVAERIWIQPYSYRPRSTTVESLKVALFTVAGLRAEIDVAPPADYGDQPSAPDEARVGFVLFNLAQTPEVEVHGRWLGQLAEGSGDRTLVALIDAGAASRLGGPQRIAERQRAWRQVLAPTGVPVVELGGAGEPDAPSLEERLEDAAGHALRGGGP